MRKEVDGIVNNLRNVLGGEPWYERSVYAILEEIDPVIVYKKPNKRITFY